MGNILKHAIHGLISLMLPAFLLLGNPTGRAQMIIDTWSLSTGVDTSLWIDLGENYTTLIAPPASGILPYGNTYVRDIGFSFTLGATTHTKFSTNINGSFRLGTARIPASGYINEPLGQNINAGPRIEAFGRAGCFDASCYMRSSVLGDSGSRVMVVETRMKDYSNMDDSLYVHFQIQLFEAGGLRIVYGDVDSGAVMGSTQNGVAATGNSSNKDVIFFDFATYQAVRFNGNCDLRNAAEYFPTEGRWFMLAPDPSLCPRATAVTTSNLSATGVVLERAASDSNTMRVMIHAANIDTVWPAALPTFTLPPLNPTTTYTLSLQTLCGSDTSYRTNEIEFQTTCGAVRHLPWSTNFNTTSHSYCWDMPYVSGDNADFNRRWRQTSTSNYVYCPNSTGTYNSWLKAPVFYLPDTDGITLMWDYKSTQQQGINPHVELRVGPCDTTGEVAPGLWTTVCTLDGYYQSYTTLYASLDAWRGQRVRVAFVRTGENGGHAYIDNLSLYRQPLPVIALEVPAVAHVGDTFRFGATMLAGADTNVTWTWYSLMLDSTWVFNSDTTLEIVYTSTGYDAISLTVSNAYGSTTVSSLVDIVDCRTVTSLPWIVDFSHSLDCWEVSGWAKTANTALYNENNVSEYYTDLMQATTVGDYMLTLPIALPATGMHNMKLWVNSHPNLLVAISPTASANPADYTDTLIYVHENNSSSSIWSMWWHTADLEPYAGQTVRIGFFRISGGGPYINQVKIDYDTLPVLWQFSVPDKSRADSTIVCSAALRRGSLDGLTFTWHSSLMDTTWVDSATTGNNTTFNLTYTLGGIDTITITANNDYGTVSMTRTVRVRDCNTVTSLPWTEDFQNGDVCWYKPEGSKWFDAIPYNNPTYEYLRHLYLQARTDTLGSWIISQGIQLPANSDMMPRLSWGVASSSANYLHLYSVMVTTSTDWTDTSNYTVLYTDSSTHVNFSNYDTRSVDLSAYSGQTIHFAFRNHPWHLASSSTGLYIDNVEIRATFMPIVTLQASNNTYYYGDTATFIASLSEGSRSNLVYTWHSTLLDTTFTAGDSVHLFYNLTSGTDTVSVVATNAYGSDTAQVVVNSQIVYLPTASFSNNTPMVGDTTVYQAQPGHFVTVGLTYTWHSTMLDTYATGSSWPVVYNQTGIDTVTLFVANTFGADTLVRYITVNSHPLPAVTLSAPEWVSINDTINYSVQLNDCSTNGLSFSWHSTLLDSTVTTTLPSVNLVYPAVGTDTITVIASNLYGADTATQTIHVFDCSPRAIPYTENFEGITPAAHNAQGELPLCWEPVWGLAAYAPHVIANGDYPYINNLPDNALLMVAGASTGYATTATVILPRMADSLPTLSLALDYRFESTSRGTLSVGYYVGTSFTTVKNLTPMANSYHRDTVYFTSATASDAQIALRWTNNTSWYAAVIDNIKVFHDTDLHAPDGVAVDSITATTARATWTAGINATAYHVVVDSLVDTIVSGLSLLLTGLTPITQYTVRVASISGSDTSAYVTAQFTTLCDEEDLPYSSDFESESTITCWTSTRSPYINDIHIENGKLYLSGSPSYSYPSLTVTPVMNHPGNAMVVDFRLQRYGTSSENNATIEVGVMTDPSDPTTFIVIDTFTATSTWTDCQFSTQNLDTTHVAIAFHPIASTYYGYSTVWVDDLNIDVPDPCARLQAAEATVLGPTSAGLSWQYATYGELAPQGVLITLHDLTANTSSTLMAHGTDTVIGGLAPAHSFSAEMRVLCSGDTSDALAVNFTPEASVCDELTGTDQYAYCFPLSADRAWGYCQMVYPAPLAASVDTLYGIALNYYGVAGEGVERTIDVYIGQTTANSLTSPISVATHTLAVQNHTLAPTGHGWVKIPFTNPVPLDGVRNLVVTIDDNTGISGYNQMTFRGHTDPIGGFLYYNASRWDAVDVNPANVTVSLATSANIPDIQLLGGCSTGRCLQPVIAVTPGTNSLIASWTQRGSENLWIVEYRMEGDLAWQTADTTADTSYTILGLNASSRYQVRVGSICDTNVIYSAPVTAATPCGAVSVPYHQSFLFNDYTDIPCWNLHEHFPRADYGMDLDYSMPIASPAILGDLSTMRVRFRISGNPNFNPILRVGVGNANGGNAIWIDSMMLSHTEVNEYIVYLSGYTGIENHILFIANQPYARMREMTIEYTNNCRPVHHITVSQLADTTALLSWPPAGEGNEWAVYLDNVMLGVTATPSYALTGLSAGATYTATVREICGAGDTADATDVSFTTLCPIQTLPWSEDFQSMSGSAGYMPFSIPCWSYIFRPLNASAIQTLAYIGTYNSSRTLAINNPTYPTYGSEFGRTNFVSSPILDPEGHHFTVTFDGHITEGLVVAGIMTDVTDSNSFIPLAAVTATETHYQFSTESIAVPAYFSVAFAFAGETHGNIDNISVTPIIPPDTVWRTVTVTSDADSTCQTYGSGRYADRSTVEIGYSLLDTEGGHWEFLGWSDGPTENPRNILVTSDTAIVARFQWIADTTEGIGTPGLGEPQIHPNPSSTDVTVSVSQPSVVTVVDLQGRTVLPPTEVTSTLLLRRSTLKPGFYFVRIGNSRGTVVKKLNIK